MAIRCPGCGREYDVALFAFGRTLHCTCGCRVGIAPQQQAPAAGEEPRFLADAMLGRLARWLRVVGADTAWDAAADDEGLARRALEEGRVLLTRDRALPEEWRLPQVLVLRSDAPLEQLQEVAGRYGLAWRGRLFRRCSVCNALLAPISRERAADRVPERVRREQRDFAECPGCGRIYWEGSHTRRMRRVLEEVLG